MRKRAVALIPLLLLLVLMAPAISQAELPIFPGAQGFGRMTPAGRGGEILRVTNLNDRGPGSLRAAIEKKGCRVVVFEVSGSIDLKSDLIIKDPFCTVAGQTAPFPGIVLTGRMVKILTHDILFQHLVVRVGDHGKHKDGKWDAMDAIQIVGKNAFGIIIDHVTCNFSIDENISIGYGAHDVTISNCMISLPLRYSVHTKGAHGYNLFVAEKAYRVSIIKNLISHGHGRNPYLQSCSALVANNLIYNNGSYDDSFVLVSTEKSRKIPWSVSIVGNTFIDGPDSSNRTMIKEKTNLSNDQSKTYFNDNSWSGENSCRCEKRVMSPPKDSWPDDFTPMPSANVKEEILAKAGARPKQRDELSKKIVADVENLVGRIINSQEEVGGFPEYEENHSAFDQGLDPHGDGDGDGYTNLEEILHGHAKEVEGMAKPKQNVVEMGTGGDRHNDRWQFLEESRANDN